MSDREERPQGQNPGKAKVVSIVARIEARKMADIQRKAAGMHLRELESSFEMVENTKALEEMDFDAMLAEVDALSPAQASRDEVANARAELRSLRALRSCLHGDTEAGFAEWTDAIDEAPKAAAPLILRARWCMGTDPAAALSDFDRAAAAEPTNPTVYARRGDCYAALGDEDRAIANYRRAVALDPSLFDVHHTMAKMFAARGDHADALVAYDRAIQIAPRYVDFYLGRAKTREKVSDFRGALRDFDRVLELDGERMDAQSGRALCMARTGDLDGSVAKMEKLLDALGDQPGAEKAYDAMGHIHLMLGHPAVAIEHLTHALSLAPDNVAALAHRGEAYWKTGDHAHALADHDRGLSLAPDDTSHHKGRAKALAGLCRMEEATAAASRAVEIAPGDSIAYFMRAIYRSHVEEGDLGVKADLGRAIDLEPDNFVYRRQRATYLMDNLEVQAALPDVEKALSLRPDNAELYYERGFCKSRAAEEQMEGDEDYEESEEDMQKRCTAALADLEKAIALGLCTEDLYFEWVRVHDEMGSDMLATLDHALAKVPDATVLLYLRRDHLHRAGDDARAEQDHKHLVELGFQLAKDDWAPLEWGRAPERASEDTPDAHGR